MQRMLQKGARQLSAQEVAQFYAKETAYFEGWEWTKNVIRYEMRPNGKIIVHAPGKTRWGVDSKSYGDIYLNSTGQWCVSWRYRNMERAKSSKDDCFVWIEKEPNVYRIYFMWEKWVADNVKRTKKPE